ncbi:MAG: hypothetical protein ACE5KM_08960 [Planctomycetaceae bacterium]
MTPRPALNLVVYRSPGPDDDRIQNHAAETVKRCTTCGLGGGLGYLTLVESDFDRLWGGVDRGDALGTAASVLRFMGESAEQFIGRVDDFVYGWVGDDQDEEFGNILLLQIIPRPHMLAGLN